MFFLRNKEKNKENLGVCRGQSFLRSLFTSPRKKENSCALYSFVFGKKNAILSPRNYENFFATSQIPSLCFVFFFFCKKHTKGGKTCRGWVLREEKPFGTIKNLRTAVICFFPFPFLFGIVSVRQRKRARKKSEDKDSCFRDSQATFLGLFFLPKTLTIKKIQDKEEILFYRSDPQNGIFCCCWFFVIVREF